MRPRPALAVLAVAAASVAAAKTDAAPPPIAQKQVQAAHVLAEISRIDSDLGRTVDAYDGARVRLAATRRELRVAELRLARARANLRIAQARLERRLVAIYESDRPSPLEILLGASSLADLVDRVEAARAVARQDRHIADAAAAWKAELARREQRLEHEQAARAREVAKLGTTKAEIEAKLARRRTLLASIRSQIVVLRARERARERRLAAEARARLARERLVALARVREREAARRRALAARRSRQTARPAPAANPPSAPSPPSPPPAPPAPPPPAPPPPAPPTPPPPPAPIGGGHPETAAIAARYLGVPYRWGGASPAGFDCSGLVMYVYAQIGIALPHYTVAQYGLGVPVSREGLQPGDLVFFDGLGHVGIYIGANQFIHAPHTGDVVKVSTITGWYARTYVGARRV
ncbi:MAG TPA: NlpC/P60 family protein [Gaiellaceae bacterium]